MAEEAQGWSEIDEQCVNTIRTLAIDAIQKANSGHPGTPMALAPVAYVLWQRFLRFDPDAPIWPNRDRFVLSAGHASMLLYALLHLTRVKAVDSDYETQGEPAMSLDDIKSFRQSGSKAAGHPEYHLTTGVETTTGPLGQGVATSVGMAIGGQWQAAHFNRPGMQMFDFDVYAICGDGDLMEGVSGEAASVAGHLRPRQPLLDLRQQPHLDRRRYVARLLGRRRRALHGLRVERQPGRGRQRPRAARARLQPVPPGGGGADAAHRRQPHRLGLAEQAGHGGGARRAAR